MSSARSTYRTVAFGEEEADAVSAEGAPQTDDDDALAGSNVDLHGSHQTSKGSKNEKKNGKKKEGINGE